MGGPPFEHITTGRPAGRWERARIAWVEITERLRSAPANRLIFVIGSGRSGTHWLGWILESHPDLQVTVEKPPIFNWVTEMALVPDRRPLLMPRLVSRYRAERRLAVPRHYVDKSHPNIWLVEALAEAFPDAKFVGMVRSVYGTVASMLKHKGVLRWVESWQQFPVPNPFLGISAPMANRYDDLSLAAKCALRWKAHEQRLRELQAAMPERLLVLSYESLQDEPDEGRRRLQAFLGLSTPFPEIRVKRQSRDRWRQELSAREIEDIEAMVREG